MMITVMLNTAIGVALIFATGGALLAYYGATVFLLEKMGFSRVFEIRAVAITLLPFIILAGWFVGKMAMS